MAARMWVQSSKMLLIQVPEVDPRDRPQWQAIVGSNSPLFSGLARSLGVGVANPLRVP